MLTVLQASKIEYNPQQRITNELIYQAIGIKSNENIISFLKIIDKFLYEKIQQVTLSICVKINHNFISKDEAESFIKQGIIEGKIPGYFKKIETFKENFVVYSAENNGFISKFIFLELILLKAAISESDFFQNLPEMLKTQEIHNKQTTQKKQTSKTNINNKQ